MRDQTADQRHTACEQAVVPLAPRPSPLVPRRGTIMIAVMVCLVIATMLLTSMLRTAASQRRALQTRGWEAQARWLAEAGLERAAARLAANGNYSGETWSLKAEQLGSQESATVRIEIQSVSNQPNRRLVRVTADYPDHPHERARQTRQATVQLRTAGEEP